MVTQQLQNFARQSIFDALAALFLLPEEADRVLSRYEDALPAAAGLAAELGVDPFPSNARPLARCPRSWNSNASTPASFSTRAKAPSL